MYHTFQVQMALQADIFYLLLYIYLYFWCLVTAEMLFKSMVCHFHSEIRYLFKVEIQLPTDDTSDLAVNGDYYGCFLYVWHTTDSVYSTGKTNGVTTRPRDHGLM